MNRSWERDPAILGLRRGLEGARKVQEVRPQEDQEGNPVEQFRADVTVLKRCQRGRVKEQGRLHRQYPCEVRQAH